MVKLVIVSTGYDYQKIIIFCDFFRLDYIVQTEPFELKLIDECTIYITSDLVPDIYLFQYIFDSESVMTEVKFTNSGAKWSPSFCTVLFEEISLLSIPPNIKMVSNITTKNPEIAIPFPNSLRTRCSVLDSIYQKYYYNNGAHDNVIARFIMHLFLEAYQQLYLKSEISAHLETTRDQSRFASSIDRKYLGSRSLNFVKEQIRKSKITLNDCYDRKLQGYLVDIDICPDKLKNSALGLPGMYKINPLGKELTLNKDITLIGFYYNFNLVGRHPENYLSSLKLWLKLKYPIAFYSTADINSKVLEYRSGLEADIVTRDLLSWPDLERYKEHLAPRGDRYYYDQTVYRLGTSIKIWSLETTILKNPFDSSIFVWFDPGFYKNDNLVCPELMEDTRIFDYLDVPKDKIIITSYLTNVGLNPDEVSRNVNTILSWLLVGYKETWLKFIPLYRQAYLEESDKLQYHTEQVILGKLYYKYPELFDIREFGLHRSYFPKILNFPHN